MMDLGLSKTDEKEFVRALASTHGIRVQVHVLNLEGEEIDKVDADLLDGQVNISNDSAASRSCSLSLLDPGRNLSFDSNSPARGALYADRMIRVEYGVRVPAISQWVDVPVFTGPVTGLSRADDVVSVECQGKEVLAQGVVRPHINFKKGHKKADTIRSILEDAAGETRFDFPVMPQRLREHLSLTIADTPWGAAQAVARSINRQLFYDGRGVCRLRNQPGNPVYKFKTGDGGTITGQPQLAFSMEDARNGVLVRGGLPKGAKTDDDPDTKIPKHVPNVHAIAIADSKHPLSPSRLGRNGVDRLLLETVSNSHVRSVKEAQQLANKLLADRLRQAVDVTLECLPVPHLDPGDMVRVETDRFTVDFRANVFSIPLTTTAAMSVGFMKRVSRIRQHRGRHHPHHGGHG